jgi:hypothetical protein
MDVDKLECLRLESQGSDPQIPTPSGALTSA